MFFAVEHKKEELLEEEPLAECLVVVVMVMLDLSFHLITLEVILVENACVLALRMQTVMSQTLYLLVSDISHCYATEKIIVYHACHMLNYSLYFICFWQTEGRSMLERKTPPAGYVCHRCKVPGTPETVVS